MMPRFTSWEDYEKDCTQVWGHVWDNEPSRLADALNILYDLRDNAQSYLDKERIFGDYLFDKEVEDYMPLLPYFHGAGLIKINFLDKDNNILEDSVARKIIKDKDEELQNNTFILFSANLDTIQSLRAAPKLKMK